MTLDDFKKHYDMEVSASLRLAFGGWYFGARDKAQIFYDLRVQYVVS